MIKYSAMQIAAAKNHALSGGQALHLHRFLTPRAPACFVREVNAGRHIAHLFDQDVDRLKKTARDLGVRVIVVERVGQPGQHIDLCGRPLARAVDMCDDPRQTTLF